MDVYEAIFSRRTIRDFQAKAINEDIIKKIIDADLHAPSNNHMREWQFVVIQDQSVRVKVIDRIQKHYTKEVVNCPADYEIPCFLALGYPGDNASKIKQHSVKAEDRIHWNCW